MSLQICQAAHILNQGGLIAYPTEAVYGLGCLAHFTDTIQQLLKLKKRSPKKGLILLASDLSQLNDYIKPLDNRTLARIQATWPGAVTWLVPARTSISELIRGQSQSVAVRISAHPIVRELCQQCNTPLISTSANISGHNMTYSAFQVRLQFKNRLDYILNAPLGDDDKPSIIRDAISNKIIRN